MGNSEALHPIDTLEFSLFRDREINVDKLLPPDELNEDLPTVLELAALRWCWWRDHATDLLDRLPVLEGRTPLTQLFHRSSPIGLLSGEREQTGGRSEGHISLQGAEIVEVPSSEVGWGPGRPLPRAQEDFSNRLRQRGFPVRLAYGLAGAFREMASNAAEHAQPPIPPVACLQVTKRSWAFSITDVGRGIRASLGDNPRYASLRRDAQALKLALQEGVSRHEDPARGRGFNTVFKALADHSATLRFRAGAAAGRWIGAGPTAQKILIQSLPAALRMGFHVCVRGNLGPAAALGLDTPSRKPVESAH